MYQTAIMCVVQCCRRFTQNPAEHRFILGAFRREYAFKTCTVDELHCNVGDILLFANLIDCDDAWMAQVPRRTCLAEQSILQPCLLIVIVIADQPDDLNCNRTPNQRVDATVDGTHATTADYFKY